MAPEFFLSDLVLVTVRIKELVFTKSLHYRLSPLLPNNLPI